MRARRWSDNDHYFGPFTFAKDGSYRPIAVVLSSADDEDRGCEFRVSAFGFTFISALPGIVRASRNWVDTSGYGWPDNPKGGYWNIDRRSYGFTISDGHLSVYLGRQTNDSSTEQRWGCFLPWTQWRFVRFSLYGLNGEHLWTQQDRRDWAGQQAAEERCPKVTFAFADFDGEELTATTHINEREWHFGEKWFMWLSWFRKPRISRSLSIKFSGETGQRKGTWKGGTVGHGIDMLPGELHDGAFARYCAEHKMTFKGRAL